MGTQKFSFQLKPFCFVSNIEINNTKILKKKVLLLERLKRTDSDLLEEASISLPLPKMSKGAQLYSIPIFIVFLENPAQISFGCKCFQQEPLNFQEVYFSKDWLQGMI